MQAEALSVLKALVSYLRVVILRIQKSSFSDAPSTLKRYRPMAQVDTELRYKAADTVHSVEHLPHAVS